MAYINISTSAPQFGDTVTALGWGATETNSTSPVLRYTTMKVSSARVHPECGTYPGVLCLGGIPVAEASPSPPPERGFHGSILPGAADSQSAPPRSRHSTDTFPTTTRDVMGGLDQVGEYTQGALKGIKNDGTQKKTVPSNAAASSKASAAHDNNSAEKKSSRSSKKEIYLSARNTMNSTNTNTNNTSKKTTTIHQNKKPATAQETMNSTNNNNNQQGTHIKGYQTVCHGDSGGPQILENTNIQVSVTSFGSDLCGDNNWEGCTNLSFFYNSFIKPVMINYGIPTPFSSKKTSGCTRWKHMPLQNTVFRDGDGKGLKFSSRFFATKADICAHECLLDSRCLVYNYWKATRVCYLYKEAKQDVDQRYNEKYAGGYLQCVTAA